MKPPNHTDPRIDATWSLRTDTHNRVYEYTLKTVPGVHVRVTLSPKGTSVWGPSSNLLSQQPVEDPAAVFRALGLVYEMVAWLQHGAAIRLQNLEPHDLLRDALIAR